MVQPNRLRLMQWDERTDKEQLMFLLHRQCEAIDYAPKYLQQLVNAAVPLDLKNEFVEDIVDGLADERAVYHELSVDAVEDGLEILTFARVLRVEEVQKAEHKGVVDVALGNLSVGVRGYDVAQEEFIDELKVWPSGVEERIFLLGVGDLGAGVLVRMRREAAEDVGGDGPDEFLLHGFSEPAGARLHEVDQLRQGLPLHLPLTGQPERLGEVEHHGADLELAEEQRLMLGHRHVAKEREGLDLRGGAAGSGGW